MKKIVLNAGGTGGHFFPAIALGEELSKRGFEIYLITDKRCEKYITPDIIYPVKIIDLRINSSNVITKLIQRLKILTSTLKALIYLSKVNPNMVISFGGYPTIPGAVAAVLLHIPTILHEQNSVLGKTNKFFARFAKVVALSYGNTSFKRNRNQDLLITGDIVRANIKNLPSKEKFDNPIFRIFVFGGSQAAKVFSELVPEAIKEALRLEPNIRLQITQQAPKSDHEAISKIYKALGISFRLSDFFHNMEAEYENSELAICRAGASTIAELTTVGLPAIFIPYPYAADNHQFFNAKALEETGNSWCMEQKEITPLYLARKIVELANNRGMLSDASTSLKMRKSDGAKVLADTVEKIISQF